MYLMEEILHTGVETETSGRAERVDALRSRTVCERGTNVTYGTAVVDLESSV